MSSSALCVTLSAPCVMHSTPWRVAEVPSWFPFLSSPLHPLLPSYPLLSHLPTPLPPPQALLALPRALRGLAFAPWLSS